MLRVKPSARAHTGAPHCGSHCHQPPSRSILCQHSTFCGRPQCNLLHLAHLKRDVSSYGLQMPAYHSWGGHAVEDASGLWNGFFSFMCNHNSLSAWTWAHIRIWGAESGFRPRKTTSSCFLF